MKDSYFYLPEDKVSRLAVAYGIFEGKEATRFPDKPVTDGFLTYSASYPIAGPKKLFSGGGGLVSTAGDYARFCQMMLDNGMVNGKRLLSRKTVELMTHDQLGKIGLDQGFGLGFGVDGVKGPMDELGSPGEFGWGGFFYTSFTIDPKEQMIVIFMAQLHPAGDVNIQNRVKTLVYEAIND
jgi:CubicO group peptidase (beta-lactamase class C family)